MGKIRDEDILGMGIGSLRIHGIFKESQIFFYGWSTQCLAIKLQR